ncbi:MAG: hypothetical protein LAO79_03340 [Acidobacteriia bacterium]|nr:hypothetical protein [Terriglobia bacterium]
MRDLQWMEGWFRERFPRHPYVYFGLSGATLLHDAIRAQSQSRFVLPAYICPSLSAMGAAAGKLLIHIEVDPRTLHPAPQEMGHEDAIVLIDHSFGYPFGGIAEVRRLFPKLLLIEDCARALGVEIGGELPGRHSDWILFSMYKTVRGSRSGAVLLANAPLSIPRDGRRGSVSMKERAGTFGPARFLYHQMLQRRALFEARPLAAAPDFEIQRGLPSELCASRFIRELRDLEKRARMRREIAAELTGGLSRIPCVVPVQAAEGCSPAAHFVSFALQKGSRDQMITKLYRRGLFVMRTWDIVPGNYESLQSTFVRPPGASLELASRMAHIPIDYFENASERERLLATLPGLIHFV